RQQMHINDLSGEDEQPRTDGQQEIRSTARLGVVIVGCGGMRARRRTGTERMLTWGLEVRAVAGPRRWQQRSRAFLSSERDSGHADCKVDHRGRAHRGRKAECWEDEISRQERTT